MLTADDIEKLAEFFATKDELNEMFERCATKEDLIELRTLVEQVLGEVKVTREELLVIGQHVEDSNTKGLLNEPRLDRIESTPTVAHELKNST